MKCTDVDGLVREMKFGAATLGWMFESIVISTDEFGGMDERYIWTYIRLRLMCRLVPGGKLTIVSGAKE